jgi:hypothetical protein
VLTLRNRYKGTVQPSHVPTSPPKMSESVCHERRREPAVSVTRFLMWCYTRDGGLSALRSCPAGGGFKPPHAALAEDRRGER